MRSTGASRAPAHVGVVLAAGGSRRLGEPKQLLRAGGQSLLRRTVLLMLDTRPGEVAVVLGHESGRMREELDGLSVSIAINDAWQSGLASSLKTAADALKDCPASHVLLVGIDQPALDASHLQALLAASVRWPGHGILSGYAGTVGIPAVVPLPAFFLSRTLDGDRGLKQILAGQPMHVVANPALAEDIDTPLALERARRQGWID